MRRNPLMQEALTGKGRKHFWIKTDRIGYGWSCGSLSPNSSFLHFCFIDVETVFKTYKAKGRSVGKTTRPSHPHTNCFSNCYAIRGTNTFLGLLWSAVVIRLSVAWSTTCSQLWWKWMFHYNTNTNKEWFPPLSERYLFREILIPCIER